MHIQINVNSAVELRTKPERSIIAAVRKRDEDVKRFIDRVKKRYPGATFIFNDQVREVLSNRGGKTNAGIRRQA